MNITRRTVITARLTGALTAAASYLWMGLFFDMLLALGNPRALCTVLGAAVAVWAYEHYRSMLTDYHWRMAVLGSAGGVGAAALAVLVG